MSSFDKILFGFSVILWWGDIKQATGYDTGHWFWGTTLYLAVLLTVLGKAALISEYVMFHFEMRRVLMDYLVSGQSTLL